MRRDGVLREFNRRYAAGRAAAAVEGRAFISYGIALARLKRALIPRLQSEKPIAGLFAEVFRACTHKLSLPECGVLNVRFAPDSDRIADIAEGPKCANNGSREVIRSARRFSRKQRPDCFAQLL
jgi:hypothetical protein